MFYYIVLVWTGEKKPIGLTSTLINIARMGTMHCKMGNKELLWDYGINNKRELFKYLVLIIV